MEHVKAAERKILQGLHEGPVRMRTAGLCKINCKKAQNKSRIMAKHISSELWRKVVDKMSHKW